MLNVGEEVLVKGRIVGIEDAVIFKNYMVEFYPGYTTSVGESCITDKTYEQGLADAWELAKKIVLGIEEGGFSYRQLEEIFDASDSNEVFERFTLEEALAKIEAYEKEKEIKVGDVVHHMGGKTFIVTYIHDDGHVSGITEEGGIYSRVGIGNVVKAGKHIDIESLLRQIGE